jgi:hypothetical protein
MEFTKILKWREFGVGVAIGKGAMPRAGGGEKT